MAAAIFCGSLAAVVPAALAQQPQQMPPPLPSPTPPSALSGLPTNPVNDFGAEPATVRMLYPNADIKEVLALYEQYTGKRVLTDPTVQSPPISILVNKPVTRSEAVRIIEIQLSLSGFTLVAGPGNIVKVLGLGKIVRNEGVPIYSELSQLPEGEQTVSYLVRLRYLDATQVMGVLAQYTPPTNKNSSTALQSSGAIILTDTANTVRRIVNLLNLLDVPSTPVVEKFIPLERADATKTVEFLNAVFETKGGSQSGGAGTGGGNPGITAVAGGNNIRRPIRRVDNDGQPVFDPITPAPGQTTLAGGLAALSGDNLILGTIKLYADIRTNRIHVTTQEANLPLVEKLVADYDSDVPFGEPVRRPLRYVNASDVLPILVSALTEPGMENGQNGAGATPATSGSSNRPNSSSNAFGNSSGNSNVSNGFGNSTGGSGGGDVEAADLSADVVDTKPIVAVVGSTKLIADPRTNTITLLGGAESKDKVFKLLDKLDVRVPQVFISVVIGELSLGDDSEFGINYLLRRKGLALTNQFSPSFATTSNTGTGTGTGTGATTGTTFTPANSSTLSTLSTLASGLPSSFSGLAGIISVTNSFDLILSALKASNRFKTISRPVVMTTNNKQALITSGQEIPVPGNSLSTLNSTTTGQASVSSTVEYRKVALTLSVVPLINSDKEVTLSIAQTIDSVAQGQSVTIGGNAVQTISTRKVKSYVSMPNGATVVLGGLITDSDSKVNSEVPLLNRIPILGDLLFKSRTRNKARNELVVLIHPQVLAVPEVLEVKRVEEENKLNMEPGLEAQLDPLPKTVRRATAVANQKEVVTTTTTATPTATTVKTSAATRTTTRTTETKRKKAVLQTTQ